MDPTAVVLYVAIMTGSDKPNFQFRLPLDTAEECISEAKRVLLHEFPDFIKAKQVIVRCEAPAKKSEPS